MKKVITMNYGEQELTSYEPVKGVEGLFKATITLDGNNVKIGYLDHEDHEVIEFGHIDQVVTETVLNNETVVIDRDCFERAFDQWYLAPSSVLLVRKPAGFEVAFASNIGYFSIDDEKLMGAFIDRANPRDNVHIIEYNYVNKTSQLHSLDRWAYDANRVQDYLDWKISPETPLNRRLDRRY